MNLSSIVKPAAGMLITFTLLGGVAALTPARHAVAQAQPSCPAQTDPNTPIVVNAGDEFAIGLPSNKTTGFSWQLADPGDENVAYNFASVYVLPAPPAGLPVVGAGGRECWIFYANAPGQTAVTLTYQRPFDPPGTPPAQSMTFSIVVQ